MGKKSGGSTPDTIGAARAAGEEARWLAREQTMANRPNQVNPWGSTTWQRTPVSWDDPATAAATGRPGSQTIAEPQRVAKRPSIGDLHNNPRGGLSWQDDPMTAMGSGGASGAGEWGGSGWGSEGGPPMYEWTQVETLNPELQAALDAQFAQQRGRSELAQSLMGQLESDMGTPMDWGKYGEVIGYDPAQQRQAAEDAAYQRSANRLDPQFEQQANQLEISLRNKGLRPGDQAYDSAMANFTRSRNDAYEQARLGATTEGRAETSLGMEQNMLANQLRTQSIQEELYKRGYTLEQINALMQGQEIEGSTPSMNEKATIADMLAGG